MPQDTPAPSAQPTGLKSFKIAAPTKFEAYGLLSQAGKMKKFTTTVPFSTVAERLTFNKLLNRYDFDIDDQTVAGNRDITESHWKKIAEGIRTSDRPYLGNITVAMGEDDCEIDRLDQLHEHVWMARMVIRETAPNPVIEDGQHRIKMATYLWPLVKDAVEGEEAETRQYLERTSIEMTFLLEDDPTILSTIFVRMGSTKPISADLIAVMDREALQNRLGLYVTSHSQLLSDRVGYLSTTASKKLALKKGRTFENLYPAAAVRSASCSMAGVGVRDRTPEQRENNVKKVVNERAQREGVNENTAIEMIGKDLCAILDYAYGVIPGWREMKLGKLTVADFKRRYVHSSAAGLHVIANVVAAGRAQGLDPHLVIDGMAKLPWDRSALRDAKDDAGEPVKVHEFFEGSLAKTSFDTKLGTWRAGTGGATRSTYEPAIDKVLKHLANSDPALKPLGEREAAIAIGLISANAGPGRPRKTTAA
ncbi:DNA sulfur modification protein DndB [Kineococcus arenarius]|uniref:DNA sulfur modification protein DndB n=1 Tax=Kineococcus sp. SYSU DK007 TaxID=3383128 RepID=UPI003D7CCD2C